MVYKEEDHTFQCTMKVSGLKPGDEANLTLWLVEDNVVTQQVVPGGVNRTYTQRHILRKALNGTWGEKIVSTQNGEWNGIRSYELSLDRIPEQCSIVAFVTATSQEEILSVINIPL